MIYLTNLQTRKLKGRTHDVPNVVHHLNCILQYVFAGCVNFLQQLLQVFLSTVWVTCDTVRWAVWSCTDPVINWWYDPAGVRFFVFGVKREVVILLVMAAFATGLCKLIYDYTQNYFRIQMMQIREVLKKLNHHLSEWDVVNENEEAMEGYLSAVRGLNEMMAFTRNQSTKDEARCVEAEREKWNTVRHRIIRLLESKSELLCLTDDDSESVASTEYSEPDSYFGMMGDY